MGFAAKQIPFFVHVHYLSVSVMPISAGNRQLGLTLFHNI